MLIQLHRILSAMLSLKPGTGVVSVHHTMVLSMLARLSQGEQSAQYHSQQDQIYTSRTSLERMCGHSQYSKTTCTRHQIHRQSHRTHRGQILTAVIMIQKSLGLGTLIFKRDLGFSNARLSFITQIMSARLLLSILTSCKGSLKVHSLVQAIYTMECNDYVQLHTSKWVW